jgi:hypothetical protein
VPVARSVPVSDAPLTPDPTPHDPRRGVPSPVLTVRREHDAAPGPATPWRDVVAQFSVPRSARPAADPVRDLLDEPELHWTPGLRRGVLALLPRPTALLRVVLTWEWSVEAADFAVHSLEPAPFTSDEVAALENWLRDAARRIVREQDAVEAAATRVVDDVVAGHDLSAPPRPAGLVDDTIVASAVLGTRVAGPDPASPFGRVDVRLPDPGDPGHEVLVDVATGTLLGHRTTLAEQGDPWAFRYVVADGVDEVTTADLVHWHDQHIQRQMLADDARQALVHLLAGIDAPASVGYRD